MQVFLNIVDQGWFFQLGTEADRRHKGKGGSAGDDDYFIRES